MPPSLSAPPHTPYMCEAGGSRGQGGGGGGGGGGIGLCISKSSWPHKHQTHKIEMHAIRQNWTTTSTCKNSMERARAPLYPAHGLQDYIVWFLTSMLKIAHKAAHQLHPLGYRAKRMDTRHFVLCRDLVLFISFFCTRCA